MMNKRTKRILIGIGLGAGSFTILAIGFHGYCVKNIPYSYRYSVKASIGYIMNWPSWNELI